MMSKILLRLAAVTVLVHIIGHLMGHSSWKTPKDPARLEVIKQMLTQTSPFMGATRSMGDYYEGYSLCITLALLLMMVMLWLFSGNAYEHPKLSLQVLIPIAVCLVSFSVVEFIFFFPFAASISLTAGILTAGSIIGLTNVRKRPAS
jgi:hypothetical protein